MLRTQTPVLRRAVASASLLRSARVRWTSTSAAAVGDTPVQPPYFDTATLIEELQRAGLTPAQASGVMQGVSRVLDDR